MHAENNPLVVNLFGGPGVGKSTTAAEVFAKLKGLSILSELVCEYAKDVVWEERHNLFKNQYYIFAKQFQRQLRLVGKNEVVVTDAPLLLSAVYNQRVPAFNEVVLEEFNAFSNLNFYLTRAKPYVQSGRYQDESGARTVDGQVKEVLDRYNVSYESIPGVPESVPHIISRVLTTIGKSAA